MSDVPDEHVVRKFREDEEDPLPAACVPIATLAILWFVDEDGKDSFVSRFNGQQRVSTSVGDMMAITHSWLHHDLGDHDYEGEA